jgi:putative membrane protein
MRISKISLVAGMALAGCATVALAADTPMATGPSGAPAMAPKEPSYVSWMKEVDTAGNAEVAEADLALGSAQSADVKAFAQKMKDVHTQANQELADLATKKSVALPTKKPSTHGLDKKSGADFDKAYLKQQVSAHEKAVKLFEKGAKSTDPDVKAWAEKTLPVVREHLEEARKLAGTPAKPAP